MKHLPLLLAALLLAAPAAAQETTPQTVALPGGATALNEVHGDWQVSCGLEEGKKVCALGQSVGTSEGQQLMALELGVVGNKAEGMLLTAFGLKLADGITLAIDGEALLGAQPFFTCMSAGCLVPLTLDEVSLSAMRLGKALEISGTNSQTNEKVTVPVSLAGFTAAYNRTAELSN